MTIEVTIIEDSIHEGNRLTTLQCRYPRFIHEQMLTHRVFSRNSASSRAKPTQRWVDEIDRDLAEPIFWGSNRPGMSAGDEIEAVKDASRAWTKLSLEATKTARELRDLGVHKQHANRVLHPFQHMDSIISGTEFENFFKLRLKKDEAQPEIVMVAELMNKVMQTSNPVELKEGEWHLPYITETERKIHTIDTLRKVSAARCARVSYSNHDGSNPDVYKDIMLADKLLSSKHLSPFEHQASPLIPDTYWTLLSGVTHVDSLGDLWSGNFKGWIQHRKWLGL